MDFEQAWARVPGTGWLTEDEARLLWRVATESNGDVLEIGTYFGRSACVFACAIEPKPAARLWLCDPFDDGHHFDVKADTVHSIQAIESVYGVLEQAGMFHRSNVFIGTEEKLFCDPAAPRAFDVLYIDGDHSMEGTLGALQRWVPRVRDGGAVLMHDFVWDGGGAAVCEAARLFGLVEEEKVGRMARVVFA